jgi:hypothetical protein
MHLQDKADEESFFLTLRMKPLWSFKTMGIIHPMTQHNIPYNFIFSDSPRFTEQKLHSTTRCQCHKWRQHVPPKHWQHYSLSHGVNTPKHNQQKQKWTLYMCLVTLKVRVWETKSDSFQEKRSAYKQKSKNCLAVMLHMRIYTCTHTHTIHKSA